MTQPQNLSKIPENHRPLIEAELRDRALTREAIRALTKDIQSRSDAEEGGLVLGLDGPWGAGKTTIAQAVANRLKSSGWLVVNVSGETAVSGADVVADALEQVITALEIRKESRAYVVRLFSTINSLCKAFVRALQYRIGSSSSIKRMVSALEPEISLEKSAAAIKCKVNVERLLTRRSFKEELSLLVEDAGIRGVFVLVDDVDRMIPGEAFKLIKDLRQFLDARRICVLLACDRAMLARQVEGGCGTQGLCGSDFLMKIVRAWHLAPKAEDEASVLIDIVSAIIPDDVKARSRLPDDYKIQPMLASLVPTYRDRVQLRDNLRSAWSRSQSISLNVQDLVLLEALKLKCPKVYSAVFRLGAYFPRYFSKHLVDELVIALEEDRHGVLASEILVGLFPAIAPTLKERLSWTAKPGWAGLTLSMDENSVSEVDSFEGYFVSVPQSKKKTRPSLVLLKEGPPPGFGGAEKFSVSEYLEAVYRCRDELQKETLGSWIRWISVDGNVSVRRLLRGVSREQLKLLEGLANSAPLEATEFRASVATAIFEREVESSSSRGVKDDEATEFSHLTTQLMTLLPDESLFHCRGSTLSWLTDWATSFGLDTLIGRLKLSVQASGLMGTMLSEAVSTRSLSDAGFCWRLAQDLGFTKEEREQCVAEKPALAIEGLTELERLIAKGEVTATRHSVEGSYVSGSFFDREAKKESSFS